MNFQHTISYISCYLIVWQDIIFYYGKFKGHNFPIHSIYMYIYVAVSGKCLVKYFFPYNPVRESCQYQLNTATCRFNFICTEQPYTCKIIMNANMLCLQCLSAHIFTLTTTHVYTCTNSKHNWHQCYWYIPCKTQWSNWQTDSTIYVSLWWVCSCLPPIN